SGRDFVPRESDPLAVGRKDGVHSRVLIFEEPLFVLAVGIAKDDLDRLADVAREHQSFAVWRPDGTLLEMAVVGELFPTGREGIVFSADRYCDQQCEQNRE